MIEREPIDFLAERRKRRGHSLRLLPSRIPMEQRVNEGWENVLCAGKEYDLADQVDQIDQRLWERGLPDE